MFLSRHFLILTLFCCSFATLSAAEPLPGADDPALRSAAILWLEGDDPDRAVALLGELAANGNVAARRFVNQIYRDRAGTMSRAQFLALLPQDQTGDRRRFQPYLIEDEDYPALVALRQISNAETSDEWVAYAETLIAASMQSHLSRFAELAIVNRADIDIEVAEFAAGKLSDDPQVQTVTSWFFAFDHMTKNMRTEMFPEEASAREARWRAPSWPDDRRLAFENALRVREWGALRAAGALGVPSRTGRTIDLPYDISPETERLSRLTAVRIFLPDDPPPPPTPMEYRVLSESYAAFAQEQSSADTKIRLCDQHCLSDHDRCVVTLGQLGDLVMTTTDYSPVLSAEQYFASARAEAEILRALGGIDLPNRSYPVWLTLPQCLSEALPR